MIKACFVLHEFRNRRFNYEINIKIKQIKTNSEKEKNKGEKYYIFAVKIHGKL